MQQQDSLPSDIFSIYVDRLHEGKEEKISFAVDSKFLDVHEEALCYTGPAKIAGKAYLAGHELILDLSCSVTAVIPCAICNAPVKVPVEVEHLYLVVGPPEYKSGIFSFQEAVREAFILETPHYAECEKNCPQRKTLERYLKQDNEVKGKEEDHYHPFADLNL